MKQLFTGVLCLWVAGMSVCSPASAEMDSAAMESQLRELTRMVQSLQGVVEKQQQEIQALKNQSQKPPVINAQAPQQSLAPVILPSGIKKILPEIGAVADMAYVQTNPKDDDGGHDRLSVREVELVLGSDVDPYSRLDTTIAFTEEDTAELEEAYLTRYGLPLDITARVGRMKPRIGKAIPVHRDSLDTVDEPLVIQRYFGAEGMSKTGVDFKKMLDIPFSPFVHEVSVGLMEGGNGEDGTAFGTVKRRPTMVSHIKNYIDLSDVTSLEVGINQAAGSRDDDDRWEVNIIGLDSTVLHHLNANQSMKLQGEVYNMNRSESFIEVVDDVTGEIAYNDIDGNVWGGYVLYDFRFHPQWAAGFRFDDVDIVDRPADSVDHKDIGYTGYLTFHQSEFARWRFQFSHFDLTDGTEDNQVMFQGTFAIGEHKHKIQ